MKQFLTSCAVFLLLSMCSNAQSPTALDGTSTKPSNAGTEFYFSFPPCIEPESTGINTRCCVYVTSSVAQSITIEVPRSNWQVTKLAQPNEVVEFIISPAVAQPFLMKGSLPAPAEAVYQGAAVHLKSQSPVVVNAVTRYGTQSDGFLVLPVGSLGLEYVVSSWPQFGAGSSYNLVSETTITAVYNETVVQFEMGGNNASVTSGGLKPGQMATFTMNKGDVLCFASNGDIQDLSGSYIKATKPVSVVSGNQCANVPSGTPNCDYLSEMELPINTWGKEYHITPIDGRKKNSYVRIYAKEKNTIVYRDGQQWLVLTRATRKYDDAYQERRVFDGAPKCVVISADKPIYVVQYNTGLEDDNVSSAPFQMALTPVEQYQHEIMFSTPGTPKGTDNYKTHYMNLVYKLGPSGNIPDDLEFAVVVHGKFEWKKLSVRFGSTPGCVFTMPVNGASYATKQLTLPGDGVFRIRSKSPLAGYLYGTASNTAYGFPASVALNNLEQKDSIHPRVTFTKNCDGSVKDGTVKDYPDDNAVRVNFGLIYMDVNPDSSYNYTFEYDKNHTFVSGDTRETDWTLNVIDGRKKARARLWFIDKNSNDTTIMLEYEPTLNVFPSDTLDFGILKKGQIVTKTFTIRNPTDKAAQITRFELRSDTVGFKMTPTALPFTLPENSTKEITITFTATSNGVFIDRIGIGDQCQFTYRPVLKAEVVSPQIFVHDLDFGKQLLNGNYSGSFMIVNTGKVITEIYGDDHIKTLNATPEFKTDAWINAYPILISPGQALQFRIDYSPKVRRKIQASITFSSDADGTDSVAILNAHGDTTVVGVDDGGEQSSASKITLNVSPNPIGASGGVAEYTMQAHGHAELTLLSSTGEHVATLAKSTLDAGTYQARIPVESLSSGSYIVRMVVGNFSLEKAVVIVK
ncbi:MAG: choice-of-anchor D domain-containing protein [Ignavibacteria bacterium]|nr:choice-of-anchor D domain-containing protein [Ignavibacteria bacterium]